MKTLHNHLILFDAECPMCNMYTKAFVATGFLDKKGRAAYQEYATEACPLLDRQRAVNEIALVDQTTGEVTYGIESLFKVFGNAVPFFKPLLQFAPFIWLMSKVYAFVSYNRRVIIPATTDDYAYQPSFKLHYRIAYLLFTWAVTAYILTAYVQLMHGLLPQGSNYREYLVCGAQMAFQGLVIGYIAKDKLWAYLGNMMTVSFGGALLLLPSLFLAHWLNVAPLFYVLYFMAVAGMMLLEHLRRTAKLKLGLTLSASWVTYRVLVLVIIFFNK